MEAAVLQETFQGLKLALPKVLQVEIRSGGGGSLEAINGVPTGEPQPSPDQWNHLLGAQQSSLAVGIIAAVLRRWSAGLWGDN